MAINIEMIANTNKMCISPVAEYTKKPSSQPIIQITAMMYRMLLMILLFFVMMGDYVYGF